MLPARGIVGTSIHTRSHDQLHSRGLEGYHKVDYATDRTIDEADSFRPIRVVWDGMVVDFVGA
jgi:hypothetical protein